MAHIDRAWAAAEPRFAARVRDAMRATCIDGIMLLLAERREVEKGAWGGETEILSRCVMTFVPYLPAVRSHDPKSIS